MTIDFRGHVNNTVLSLYRVFAIISLYAVLAGVVVFAFGAAFYAASHTWIAPVILSSEDKDTLDLTGKVTTTVNTVEDLKLDIIHLQKQLDEAQNHRAELHSLLPELEAAIQRERIHNSVTGSVLVGLTKQKAQDNIATQAAVTKLHEVETTIDTELTTGLITKTDAIQLKAQFAKSNSDLTDSQIAALLLRDNILVKTTPSTTYLDVVDKKAELVSEITVLDITITMNTKQIDTERSQVDRLNAALKDAANTPFAVAATEGQINMALVPYDNQKVAAPGAPVYDCVLSFLICKRVGTVKRVFKGEQHTQHPIFHTDLRGYLVQLNLVDAEAVKSRTLFVSAKPLFF